jgi:hypothetical protein
VFLKRNWKCSAHILYPPRFTPPRAGDIGIVMQGNSAHMRRDYDPVWVDFLYSGDVCVFKKYLEVCFN